MPRNVTITFDDGSTHSYQNVPDTVTPDEVEQRASSEFSGKKVTNIAGDKAPATMPADKVDSTTGKTYVQLQNELSAFKSANDIQNVNQPQLAKQTQVSQNAIADYKKHDPTTGGGQLNIAGFDTGIHTPQIVDRLLSGAGAMYNDIGLRGKQLYDKVADFVSPSMSKLITGQSREDITRQQIAETRRINERLDDTTSGKIGRALALAPAAYLAPATVPGAAISGAVSAELQPTMNNTEELVNPILGAATAAGTQYGLNKIGQYASNALTQNASDMAAQKALNAPRDAVLQTAKEAGLQVPPTAVNQNLTNTALESVAGKAATRQAMGASNSAKFGDMIKQDFADAGYPIGNGPLTRNALESIRSQAGKAYEAAKAGGIFDATNASLPKSVKISTEQSPFTLEKSKSVSSKDLVEAWKQAAANAQDWFKSNAAAPNPLKLKKANQFNADAKAIEDFLIDNLSKNGKTDVASDLLNARNIIAKTYSIEKALKNGSVDGTALAKQLVKGKPLSGNAKIIGQFAEHFPDVAKKPNQSGIGVNHLAAALGGGEIATSLAFGHPGTALVGAGIAAAPYASRAGITSSLGQSLLTNPNYSGGLISTGLLKGTDLLSKNLRGATLAQALQGAQ